MIRHDHHLVLALLCCASPAAATTWTVDASGGADYTTIQDAIDVASDGDTIDVSPGTYVDLDGDGIVVLTGYLSSLDVTIRASAAGVTIDGEETATGIACWGGDLTLEGIDFVDCRASESWGGGGLMARNNDDAITVSSCSFTDCDNDQSFGKGGALSLYSTMSSQPITYTVSDTSFTGCSATSYGGSIYLRNASGTMTDCSFDGSTATNGAALEARGGTCQLDGCTFSNNIGSSGGAIRVYDSGADLTATSCRFVGNDASYGAAVYAERGVVELVSCDIEDNVSSRSGAVHVRDSAVLDVSYSYFSLNEATESGYDTWHAISGDEGTPLSITNTTFCDHPVSGEIEIAYTDGGGNDLGGWCCPGDLDEDGDVDAGDITLFLSAFGSTLITADDRPDVTRDDAADVYDLLGLLANWGVCE